MNYKNFIFFTAGAAVGSAATYFIVKKKFEADAQKEIDDVVESFRKERAALINRAKPDISEVIGNSTVKVEEQKMDDTHKKVEEESIYEEADEPEEPIDEEVEEYHRIIEDEDYDTRSMREIFADEPMREKKTVSPMSEEEYLTHPYPKDELTLYKDNIIAYSNDEIYPYTKEIPKDSILDLKKNRLGSFYIRDEHSMMDYEIVYDNRTYYDVTGIDYKNYR